MKKNRLNAYACAALLLCSSAPAVHAGGDGPTASHAALLTTNVTLASQYVSRGIRQTWDKPALQAGIDYAHPSGFSAGIWASTINDKFVENGTVEFDLYGGYGGRWGEIGYTALLYVYRYPGAIFSATGTKYDYSEVSLGLSYGFLYAKYNRNITRDFFGISNARGTGYVDLGANYDLSRGYTLNAHYGNGRVAGAGNEVWNWTDYKIGFTKAMQDGWSFSAAYTKARGKTNAYEQYTLGIPDHTGAVEVSNVAKGTFVLAATKMF